MNKSHTSLYYTTLILHVSTVLLNASTHQSNAGSGEGIGSADVLKVRPYHCLGVSAWERGNEGTGDTHGNPREPITLTSPHDKEGMSELNGFEVRFRQDLSIFSESNIFKVSSLELIRLHYRMKGSLAIAYLYNDSSCLPKFQCLNN